jgi:tRNA threonylcarbamoyladenosine dehydratase
MAALSQLPAMQGFGVCVQVALLAACTARRLPALCCAGAGAKADPTRLRLCDVSESTADPLARAVRKGLRAQHGITRGVQASLCSADT